MIGDSLMVQMQSTLSQVGTVRAYTGSGLINLKTHNWLRDETCIDPNVLNVVVLGTNDAQAVKLDGVWYGIDTPKWALAYEGRVTLVMARAPRRLLWVIPPRVGAKRLDQRLDLVRGVILKAALISGVEVLDARKTLGEEKQFDPRMHTPDRIHLSRVGILCLSEAIEDWLTQY